MTSRRAPSGLAWEPGEVYTLHFVPKLQHAGHYTGWATPGRTPRRLIEHYLGRGKGARITEVQRKADGDWVLVGLEPGTRDRETTLKERGAGRRCGVCKAERAYKAGELTAEEALKAAGWDRMTAHEKGLLVRDPGLPEVPASLAADLEAKPEPVSSKPIEQRWPQSAGRTTPEQDALVDGLIAKWRAELDMPEAERELEAG